ncbi:MAG: endo-1,4-beta-xylanase [Luteolibacter sp.]
MNKFLATSLFAMACAVSANPACAETKLPQGDVLIPAEVSVFKPGVYVEDKSTARIEEVTVADRPFTKALRLTTIKTSPQVWQIGVNAKTNAAVHKGDVLWVTFQSRRIQSRRENGEARAEVTFMVKDGAGLEVRPLEHGFSCGMDWIETSIAFVMENDAPAGAATLAIRFGGAVQSLEVGGLTLINCGPKADIAKLPHSVNTYEGEALDAPWRAAAAERIERIRKGDFNLRVVDTKGKPIAHAEVAVRMRRHAFSWGTTVDSGHIVDDKSPNGVRYRETLEKYFNKVVFDNEMKWRAWNAQKPAERQRILSSLDWFDARSMAVRGHVMVWPSWQNTPSFLRQFKDDTNALRSAVTKHIAEQTAIYGDRFEEWDVINETYVHNDLIKLLGRDVMIDWFREAHAGAPKVKLFYNDFIMFQGSAPNSPSQYYYDLVKFFKEKGAPLAGIGEQGHFGGNPPGPAQIIASLDRFGELGYPIQITEFDIETPDEQLKANFTRDFTTAIFSSPSVVGMVQWGFWAGAHWKPSAALWRYDWTLTPAGQAWVDLVSKTWWTNADGRTSADGTYSTRGFYGDYDVTITHAGRSKTVQLKLQKGAAVQTITLPIASPVKSP